MYTFVRLWKLPLRFHLYIAPRCRLVVTYLTLYFNHCCNYFIFFWVVRVLCWPLFLYQHDYSHTSSHLMSGYSLRASLTPSTLAILWFYVHIDYLLIQHFEGIVIRFSPRAKDKQIKVDVVKAYYRNSLLVCGISK